jgi:branched chain amino acid efflux pump
MSATTAWIVVVLVGVATIAIKALGPILMGGRPLPPKIDRMLALLAPAMLSALVAINTFASGRQLVVDARLLGVGAAAVAIRLKAPILVVVVVAAVVTATVRSVTA